MIRLVTLSVFLLLSSILTRRDPAVAPTTARVQPSYPGPAVAKRQVDDVLTLISTGTGPVLKPGLNLLGRFIKDADYGSGFSPSAFSVKAAHKRASALPNTGSTTFRFDNVEGTPPKLPAGSTPRRSSR
ncbi:hypothetical protein B0F90DRAFT_1699802 [Multifurca ochricompacta]|uniref:Uncharacterized protein n=1 Tax=Multifurca ochricompacta TaxID=376703 RepID=A0AAD4M8X0_9AGAM|nr:hypothetical protein B0F90DRAFT_1699802 [Multifurca ochricompacta]